MTITGAVRSHARDQLAELGTMGRNERWLVVVMLGVMAGWVTNAWHGMHNTVVALTGVCVLLLAGVLTWGDLLAEQRAWDALIWFAPLLMMADALNEAGVPTLRGGTRWRPSSVQAATGYKRPAAKTRGVDLPRLEEG
jgi:DASS family divalent anion:Na+ symporter